jgi:hypothetical protein
LVVDALEACEITYLIGGAVAVWAWGEPRTTQDFDLVIHLPGERIRQLSQELAARRMLVPPDILLDLLIQPEGDLPAWGLMGIALIASSEYASCGLSEQPPTRSVLTGRLVKAVVHITSGISSIVSSTGS